MHIPLCSQSLQTLRFYKMFNPQTNCHALQVNWEHAEPKFKFTEELIEEAIPGDHGAQRLSSSYKVMADRNINRVLYKCSLADEPSVSKNVTLHVKC